LKTQGSEPWKLPAHRQFDAGPDNWLMAGAVCAAALARVLLFRANYSAERTRMSLKSGTIMIESAKHTATTR
jgi:hypothetical protein